MEAQPGSGQATVFISRRALLHNVKLVRRAVGMGVKICAMVKADAYGHGARIVADALTNWTMDGMEGPAVDALAVVTVEEGMGLGDVSVPVMVLRPSESVVGGRQRETIEEAIRRGWWLTVATTAGAADLARVATRCGRRANVQVMVDTGCMREGTAVEELPRVLEAIESSAALRLAALCTHFVNSEEPGNAFTLEQMRRFRSATGAWAARGEQITRHAANSGAVFFSPATHLDMVRPGIALYGIDPTCRPNVERALRPVMRWVAPILMVRDVKKGTSVGYNQTWTAPRDTRIGLVPVGYADGYLRSLSNRAKMMVHGKAVAVVGRVSMDYVTLDLGDAPEARGGDLATVLDNDPLSPASAYSLAEIAGTIPYEVLSRIGPRMKRVAVEPAEQEEHQRWPTAASTSAAKSA